MKRISVFDIDQAIKLIAVFKSQGQHAAIQPCPVCEGKGKLGRIIAVRTCDVCNGNAWIIVVNSDKELT